MKNGYSYEVLVNARKSLCVLGCIVNGDFLDFEIGIFAKGLKGDQTIRSDRREEVKLDIQNLDTSKDITILNGSLKIIK